ncbi:MAG: AMP-binding protein [Pseudomonadota bacterium]
MPSILTLGAILETNARRAPERTALVAGTERRTHAQLLERAKKLASAWHKLGLRRQDRVGILAQNCIEYCEVYAAGELSGYITATVNFRLAAPEMSYIVNDSTPRVLVFEAAYEAIVEQLMGELKSVEHFVRIGGDSASLPAWALGYEEVLAGGAPDGPPLRAREEDIAYLIYTSGTTGRPKGCMLGQREEYACALSLSAAQRSTADSRILLMMPFFHIGAKAVQMAHSIRGGAVHVQRGFTVETVLEEISREQIHITHMAPVMVQQLLESPLLDRYDIGSLKSLIYAAAPMPLPVLRKGIDLLGDVFMQMYGQTEVIGSALLQHQHRPGGTDRERTWLASVGQGFDGVAVRIVDEAGNECPRGQPGEIVIRSDAMFRGYWNNSAATVETLRDGWCHTGDIGRLDDEDFLFLVDRKKDMIISGGENIYSREVEDAVIQHPAVAAVAVIATPDPKWGESVRAVVVRKAGSSVSEAEIIEHTRTLIASYKKPRTVVFVDQLPVLPSGKVNKVELRRSCAQQEASA